MLASILFDFRNRQLKVTDLEYSHKNKIKMDNQESDKNSNFEQIPNELKLSVEDPAKKAVKTLRLSVSELALFITWPLIMRKQHYNETLW